MAIHFVSSADGNDANTGHDLDNAWATVEYALESGALVAGDTVAVRRTHSEIPTSDIALAYDGDDDNPIIIFGCPRDTFSITSATWTNGDATVDLILPASMDREQHQGRYITAPDGETYLITYITDSNTFELDREYAGSTVVLGAGAATIQADDAESDWDDYDDSGDVIKKTDWEADNDDLPVIDFNDTAYQMYIDGDRYHIFRNMEFKDTTDLGIIRIDTGYAMTFEGCLFKQTTQSDPCIYTQASGTFLKRCIFEGSGAGSAQRGIYFISGFLYMKDCAIYNMGDNGLFIRDVAFLENVNIGVEQANGDNDIAFSIFGQIYGRDVKLGGSNGYVSIADSILPYGQHSFNKIAIENYQKILGDNRTWYAGGYFEKAAVSGETPNKKVSDDVIKITPNVDITPIEEWAVDLMVHEIELTADTHTLKYWIYNDSGSTLNDTTAKDDIWLKAEYVKAYDDTSEYVMAEAFSTEIDILDAADADDWDELSVTITTAVAGKVRLTIYLSFYDAADNIFIDPAVVIS